MSRFKTLSSLNELIGVLILFFRLLKKYLLNDKAKLSKELSSDVDTIHVIGNGPSFTKTMHLISEDSHKVMVNFAPLNDHFFDIRPNYLCFFDPAFFSTDNFDFIEQKKRELIEKLELVDWDLKVIIPASVQMFSINNKKVTALKINDISLSDRIESRWLTKWIFKLNLAMPRPQNVVVAAIYFSIQKGYDRIFLHGVDSDSYKKISLDEFNNMVMEESHFYGTRKRVLNSEGKNSFNNLSERLECEVIMFRSYDRLAEYASCYDISVINLCENSMIGSFVKAKGSLNDKKQLNIVYF
ncbi:hypothetical protein ACPV56_14240 [Vibrio astriarenae]